MNVTDFPTLYLLLRDSKKLAEEIQAVPQELLWPVAHKSFVVPGGLNSRLADAVVQNRTPALQTVKWFIEKGGGTCPE